MRALVLTPDFPPQSGGIQLVMERLVENFAEVEPFVVTLGHPLADQVDETRSARVVRVASAEAGSHRLAVARLNLSGFRQGFALRSDAVIAGHVAVAPAAAGLRAARRIPVVQYLHADEFRHRPRLVRFAIAKADNVIAVSGHTRRMALEAGCNERKLQVIHPGVDLPVTAPEGRAGRPTILTVARLSVDYKGHDVMIRALASVRSQVPDVQWVVVGDGPLRGQLQQMASAYGVRDIIHFVGRVSDGERNAWLSRADLFAMPSRLPDGGVGGEGFGIVYLEAAAHGLPVVAGSVGGAVDAVENFRTGLLVDPTDHRAVAAAITSLLTDPAYAAALGEAGRRRAECFSWRRHAHAVECVLRELVEGR